MLCENDADGNTGITKPKLYPRDGDEYMESAKLTILMEAIEKYTDLLILLIETNRGSSSCVICLFRNFASSS